MIGDTIQAVSSPPGASARGVLRVSGPDALGAVAGVLCGRPELRRARAVLEATVEVQGYPVEALVLVMPGPRSFTGEDVVELHLPGSPLLLEHVAARLAPGARPAAPGEFTRRAFENRRLDLAGAEAVLALIHAATGEQRRHALYALRGGLSAAVDKGRAALLDALALLEAGLDFEDGETGAVDSAAWLPGVRAARDELEALVRGMPHVQQAGDLLLVGAANAGKSSLCNALAGRDAVLVGGRAGTTRDVVAVELAPGVSLLDGPGDLDAAAAAAAAADPAADAATDAWDHAAVELRARLAARCAGVIAVVEPGRTAELSRLLAAFAGPPADLRVVAVVQTKADRDPRAPGQGAGVPDGVPLFVVSNRTGLGVDALRAWLCDRFGGARAGRGSSDALGRAASVLGRARDAVADALAAAAAGAGAELVAVDLNAALERLDEVHGRSSPEDLLDRIFGRFCLGK